MKNWKTTLFGALAAVGLYLSQTYPTGLEHTLGVLLSTAGAALAGLFAKDSNVTGGTVVQPSA
ncbi:MAG: hypothetical protein WCS70_06810 [Verrucomicrobiota bacterium]